MPQIKRLTDKVKYLEGDYYLKGKELLEPSDPHAQLVEDHTRLKADYKKLMDQKVSVTKMLSDARKKVNDLEAMDEEELVSKVGVWLGSVALLEDDSLPTPGAQGEIKWIRQDNGTLYIHARRRHQQADVELR